MEAEFGLSLFGFDVICPRESPGGMLVVDVNYFPSYKEVTDFPRRLRSMLIARAQRSAERSSFDLEGFRRRFDSIEQGSGFVQELEIAADCTEVLWWLHPRRCLSLDALSTELECSGNDEWWLVKVKERRGVWGLPIRFVSTLEALVVHEGDQTRVLSVEALPGGQRHYTVWSLRRRGSVTVLTEDVRSEIGALGWMIRSRLRRYAWKAHKELLQRIKLNSEAHRVASSLLTSN